MKSCPKCQKIFDPFSIHGEKKFCSRSCANSRPKTEEQKEAARIYAINNPVGWALNPRANKSSEDNKLTKKWKALRQNIQCLECKTIFEVPYSKRSRKYCSVECSNKNKYHQNSSNKIISFIDGYKMDSGAEALFAKKCNEIGIKWIKNSETNFEFIDSNGKKRRYYPDFFLPDYDVWVEIKGLRYIRKDDHLRREAVKKPVFLIISNQFDEDFTKFIRSLTN